MPIYKVKEMYRLTNDPTVIVNEDTGQIIPLGTRDWDTYQTWLATGNTPDPILDLETAITIQTNYLSVSCATEIYLGFNSNALGVWRHYPAKDTDQQNLAASVLSAVVAQISPTWQPNTNYIFNQAVTYNNQTYVCTQAGTSGTSIPVWPTQLGNTITDNTTQWQIWYTTFWCTDANNNWAYTPHTAEQIKQAGVDGKLQILACLQQNATLAAEVSQQTTVEAVQTINWISPVRVNQPDDTGYNLPTS
jgi:hypothetical protein